MDAVLGDAQVAIEIKSVEEVLPKHLRELHAFKGDYPHSRCLIVSLDRITRQIGDIEQIYIHDFLHMLWHGEIV